MFSKVKSKDCFGRGYAEIYSDFGLCSLKVGIYSIQNSVQHDELGEIALWCHTLERASISHITCTHYPNEIYTENTK